MGVQTKKMLDIIQNVYHISSLNEKELLVLNLIESAKNDGMNTIEFREFVYDNFNKYIKAEYKFVFDDSQFLVNCFSSQEKYFSEGIPIKKSCCFEEIEKSDYELIENFGYDRNVYDGKKNKTISSVVFMSEGKKYLFRHSCVDGKYEKKYFGEEIEDIKGLNEFENDCLNSMKELKKEVEFLYNVISKTKTNTNTGLKTLKKNL